MESEGTGPFAGRLVCNPRDDDRGLEDRWEMAGGTAECNLLDDPKAQSGDRSKAPADRATPLHLSGVDGHTEEPMQGKVTETPRSQTCGSGGTGC